MVTDVISVQTRSVLPISPRIIELVGPAGSGKTTLSRALQEKDPHLRLVHPPLPRDPRNAPFFLRYGLRFLPGCLRRPGKQALSPQQLVMLATLQGWHNTLQSEAERLEKTLLLDQGPVYMLAFLEIFGPGFAGSPWRYETMHRWRQALDLIVWLDAPDSILISRVRERPVPHGIQLKTDTEAVEFLSNYRSTYQEIIATMQANHHPRLLCFDTSRFSADEISSEIISTIHPQAGLE